MSPCFQLRSVSMESTVVICFQGQSTLLRRRAGAHRLLQFRRRWWTQKPEVDDSVFPSQISRKSGASDWVGCQDVHEIAGGITHICVGQKLGLVRAGRRNQTIHGFRGKTNIGIAALSYYSALRQLRMSGVVPSPFPVRLSRGELKLSLQSTTVG